MAANLISQVIPGAVVYGNPQLQSDGDLVALAFAADGSLWSVEEPGVVRHWNAETGQLLAWHSSSDLETLWCFSADGRVLASASDDLSIWDTTSIRLLTALPQPDWVTAVAFHPDPNFVATGSDDGVVRFWDAMGPELLWEFNFHTRGISAVAISPDGRRLAAAGEDKYIHVWRLSDGKHLSWLTGHTDRIPALVWLPDSRQLVSAGWDRTARLWDTEDGRPIILLDGHAAQVLSLALSQDGGLLACADSGRAVHIWDLADRRRRHVLNDPDVETRCLAFSPDGRQLACADGDRVIRLWDTTTGQALSASSRRLPASPGMALSPNGKLLALNHGRAGPEVWDVAGRQFLCSLAESEPVNALAFSPDSRWIAGGTDTQVQLWNAGTGQLQLVLEGQEEPCSTLVFAPDSQTLATASSSETAVWLWRVASGEPILLIPDPLQGCVVEAVAFHPEGRLLAVGGIDWLATGGSDGAISFWDVVERSEVATFIGGCRALAFDCTGRRLASASLHETVKLWDVQTGEFMLELFGHDGQVLCVAFSPNGRTLATGGEDRTVRLWDAISGAILAVRELDTQVRALTFSEGGQQLFTGNGNTTCYRLPVAAFFS